MEDRTTHAQEPLLYDPLFEAPPDTTIRDRADKGIWGKAVVRKATFILVLLVFVGTSIALSFNSLNKDRFQYEITDGGYMLSEFNASEADTVLTIDAVLSEDGTPVGGETVVAVREWALCCNAYTQIIRIGKDVREIANTSFYSCTALQAILVDPQNPYFLSVDGVLYRQENGRPTELMLYPAKNYLYRASRILGEDDSAELEKRSEKWMQAQQEDERAEDSFGLTDAECGALREAMRYEILPGVERIGEMAFAECENLFAVVLPEGIREFASMSFFKCAALRSLRLPDTTEIIGSDAFSYCTHLDDIFIPACVRQIGHHAFYGCDGADTVRMACAEDQTPECGQDWAPKKRRVFLHDVPILYGEKRGAES